MLICIICFIIWFHWPRKVPLGEWSIKIFFFFVLGNGEVESRTRSGSRLSFKTLKRKFSLPEKGQDYSFVKTEVGYLIEKNCYIAGVLYSVHSLASSWSHDM